MTRRPSESSKRQGLTLDTSGSNDVAFNPFNDDSFEIENGFFQYDVVSNHVGNAAKTTRRTYRDESKSNVFFDPFNVDDENSSNFYNEDFRAVGDDYKNGIQFPSFGDSYIDFNNEIISTFANISPITKVADVGPISPLKHSARLSPISVAPSEPHEIHWYRNGTANSNIEEQQLPSRSENNLQAVVRMHEEFSCIVRSCSVDDTGNYGNNNKVDGKIKGLIQVSMVDAFFLDEILILQPYTHLPYRP